MRKRRPSCQSPSDPLEKARLRAIRKHVEMARREVKAAHELADDHVTPAPLRVRLAIGRTLNILLGLIHRLPPR
jgi:hypothetical protein